MTQITFKPSINTINNPLQSLCNTIINFLSNNGMHTDSAKSFVKVGGYKTIFFNFDCANNSYTKAIALLQLVLSTQNSFGYLAYRKDAIQLHVSKIEELEQHIINHSNIEII